MARYKILLLRDDGNPMGEIMVNALWRTDAVHTAKQVAEDAAAGCCCYEVWRDERKVAEGAIAFRLRCQGEPLAMLMFVASSLPPINSHE